MSPQRAPARLELVCLTALLSVMALWSIAYWKDVPQQPGIDFHQFWAVARVQRLSGYELGSPYGAAERYTQALDAFGASSDDANLRRIAASSLSADLTASPLLFYLFGLLPDRYSFALNLIRALELASFMFACGLMLRPARRDILPSLVFCVTLTAAFDPCWSGSTSPISTRSSCRR